MGEGGMTMLAQQLAFQVPALLVYLVGTILSLVFLRRWSAPAILCLIGCGLAILTIVAAAIAQSVLQQKRIDDGWTVEEYARMLSAVGFAGSVVRALAVGLVVAAVFVGRSRAPGSEPGSPERETPRQLPS